MPSAHYLDELSPSQREAVLYTDGPSLVIAGAGSGKTRVLTYKIAYLLEQGFEPWSILALTFTNKAADEMKARIARQVGEGSARRLWMGTFHSIFARILRAECQTIGFTSNFTIYDAADSKSLVKSIIKEMKLDEKQYKPSRVLSHISAAKNRLLLPDSYRNQPDIQRSDAANNMEATGTIYARYWARCRQANAMDFDDILLYTYLLFFHYPEIRQRYEQRFRYVLVDEYQDTNYAQHAIVWQLTEHTRQVCVVGDDAQSIYSFRGANIDNILTFQKLYGGARLFKLEQNYRSTQNIVGAANSLIHKNHGQIQKDVFSRKEEGQKLHLYEFFSDIEEANGVARKIQNLQRYDHMEWHDIAILYRTNAQSRSFEEAFRKQGIPYRVYGGTSFYQRKEIKDLIAYFRLAVNPSDEESLRRVINYPARGIGQTTIAKLIDTATAANVSLWQVISNPLEHHVNISSATASKLTSFASLVASFQTLALENDAAVAGQQIAKQSGVIAEVFRGRDPEDLSRQENVQELLDGMQQFVDERTEEEGSGRALLANYLQEISLISDIEETGQEESDDKVSLMTIHSAKGLEFRVVFIVGMEENLFPNQMANGSVRELEEERRLFYVAITRAEEQCFLTYAKNRYRYGKSEFCTPSSFLNDIDEQFIQFESSSGQRTSVYERPRDNAFSMSRSPFGEPSASYRNTFGSQSGSSRNSYGEPSMRPSDASFSSRFTRLKPVSQGYKSSGSQAAPGEAFGSTSHSNPSNTNVSGGQSYDGALRVGQHIEHSRFGRGEITALSGAGIDAKATVVFENVGQKQLLLRFAKFTTLD